MWRCGKDAGRGGICRTVNFKSMLAKVARGHADLPKQKGVTEKQRGLGFETRGGKRHAVLRLNLRWMAHRRT